MPKNMNRIGLLSGAASLAAIAVSTGFATPALAQSHAASGLDVIIVTAQKREQNVQDVPIAVTALTTDALEANRVTNVSDLSALAPGLTVSQAVGGALLPSFSMRGAVSLGVTPGTDKQISTYLDGVYLSAARGAMFNLPNLAAIEVLRGPQGTLFGRNATAGAVSIRTRDPDGEFGVKMTGTAGNQKEYGFKVGVDLPQVGPFSAYISYVRDHRRGDIHNVGPKFDWDRTSSLESINSKVQRTANWLGSTNSHSLFGALKFESGDFTTVYKFDWSRDRYTPQANLPIGVNASSPLVGAVYAALISSQPTPVIIATDGRRPDEASNGWVVRGLNKTWGHNVTSTFQASDQIQIKNIFAYRATRNFAASSVDGISGLIFTPQTLLPYATYGGIVAAQRAGVTGADLANPAIVGPYIQAAAAAARPFLGQPFVGAGTEGDFYSRQISDELQINYESDFLTAVVGGLYFLGKTTENAAHLQPTLSYTVVPNAIIPSQNIGEYYNRAKSLAGYAQLDFHLTPELDVTLGGRITNDKKTGYLFTGPTEATARTIPFTYDDTRFTYLIGASYKPTPDTMVYGKYSTAFVSGGTVAGIPFNAETAKSFEIGGKAEFLDRKVRANIALYHVKYNDVQYIGGGTTYRQLITDLTNDPLRANAVQSFIFNPGSPLVAKGVELDLTIAPTLGLTMGTSVAYTDAKYSKPENLRADLLAANSGQFIATGRPKWAGSAFIQYNTQPVFEGGYLSFRLDTAFQSKKSFYPNPDTAGAYAAEALGEDSYALFNGRIALTDIEMGGAKSTIALWGKNLFDERRMASAYDVRTAAVANFIPARAYGIDVTFEY